MIRKLVLPTLLAINGWLMVACNTGATVALRLSIPEPVVAPLPVNVGVYFSPEMDNFTYVEKIPNFGQFKFNMNNSHTRMFRTVFGAMFAQTQEMEELDFAPSRLDGVIVPRVEEIQIALPQQTRSDYYEVWIRYTLVLHRADGAMINQWQIAAYGKANRRDHSRLGASTRDAIQEAGEWALRDAAATIAHSFATQPAHQQWLARASRI